jgi:predicted nucleotidyltransferase
MDSHTEVLQKLIPGLVDILGESIIRIILYGSVARGTQTDESDVDIAVLVKSYTKDMHERMTDYIVDLELEYNKVLSVLLIDYEKFTEWENVMPFYKNVKKEGIVLWPAA